MTHGSISFATSPKQICWIHSAVSACKKSWYNTLEIIFIPLSALTTWVDLVAIVISMLATYNIILYIISNVKASLNCHNEISGFSKKSF